jgi:hypothetical protein
LDNSTCSTMRLVFRARLGRSSSGSMVAVAGMATVL